jgi:succinyl-diaminopimelate desuccinylase
LESAKLLHDLGFKVEQHKVPDGLVRKHGMRSVTNLVIRERFGTGDGPTIALNAHGDVVPPGLGWSVDPYAAVEKNGAIYGRGAAVSKSDFATYAIARGSRRRHRAEMAARPENHQT